MSTDLPPESRGGHNLGCCLGLVTGILAVGLVAGSIGLKASAELGLA